MKGKRDEGLVMGLSGLSSFVENQTGHGGFRSWKNIPTKFEDSKKSCENHRNMGEVLVRWWHVEEAIAGDFQWFFPGRLLPSISRLARKWRCKCWWRWPGVWPSFFWEPTTGRILFWNTWLKHDEAHIYFKRAAKMPEIDQLFFWMKINLWYRCGSTPGIPCSSRQK